MFSSKAFAISSANMQSTHTCVAATLTCNQYDIKFHQKWHKSIKLNVNKHEVVMSSF